MAYRVSEDERRRCVYGSAFLTNSVVGLLVTMADIQTLAGDNLARSLPVGSLTEVLTTTSKLAISFFVTPRTVREVVQALFSSHSKTLLPGQR